MIFSVSKTLVFLRQKMFQHCLIKNNFNHEHFFLITSPQKEEEAQYINFLDYSNDINALREISTDDNKRRYR